MRSTRRYAVPAGFFARGAGSCVQARDLAMRRIGRFDDEYPRGLEDLDEPPERLWVAGRDLSSLGPAVAVIGARNANQYGLNAASRIAGDLAAAGVCVVSGMARGCDAAAHDGALELGGATVAVLAGGADVCYPASSRVLYAEIAARGAIVSANPPGAQPRKHDFLRRNEIMVGMALAVVVVQGAATSAAVRTGFRAAERRRVFAVPGSIEWPESEGVHELLKQGASPCTRAADVGAALGEQIAWTRARPIPDHLPEPQQRVLAVLGEQSLSREQAVSLAGLDAVEGSRAISSLEIAGYLAERGFRIVRIR